MTHGESDTWGKFKEIDQSEVFSNTSSPLCWHKTPIEATEEGNGEVQDGAGDPEMIELLHYRSESLTVLCTYGQPCTHVWLDSSGRC